MVCLIELMFSLSLSRSMGIIHAHRNGAGVRWDVAWYGCAWAACQANRELTRKNCRLYEWFNVRFDGIAIRTASESADFIDGRTAGILCDGRAYAIRGFSVGTKQI